MSPLWQFNLLPDAEGPFPSCFINISEKGSVEIDETYETESARLYDAGFRLWHQGRLLESSKEEISAYKKLQPPTPRDEYRFIKKY